MDEQMIDNDRLTWDELISILSSDKKPKSSVSYEFAAAVKRLIDAAEKEEKSTNKNFSEKYKGEEKQHPSP